MDYDEQDLHGHGKYQKQGLGGHHGYAELGWQTSLQVIANSDKESKLEAMRGIHVPRCRKIDTHIDTLGI